MQQDYLFWASKRIENVCQLVDLKGVEREWELDKGIPRMSSFPVNATMRMDDKRPNNTLLADNLFNTCGLIVVSERLKKYLSSQNLVEVEYLSLTIIDHKGRVASTNYFIVHPTNPVNC